MMRADGAEVDGLRVDAAIDESIVAGDIDTAILLIRDFQFMIVE